MKALVAVLLFVGCTSRISATDRYAMILVADSSYGSAVSLGKGYFLTAAHVVGSEPFLLVTKDGEDSTARVVWEKDDIALLKSRWLGLDDPTVRFGSTKVGERVWFIHPVVTSTAFRTYTFFGTVCRNEDSLFVIDHAAYPGVSGSGVFRDDALVGIVVAIRVFWGMLVVTEAIPVSPYLALIEWRMKGGAP